MKRSLVKRSIATLMLFSIFTMMFSASAFAATTPRIPGGYYLAEGVGHVDYYITTGAAGYTTLINNAANNWVNTGFGWNPIYMYRTYNFNASNMDIYGDQYIDFMNAYSYGAMTLYVDVTTTRNVGVNPENSFWDYGEIYLNSTKIYGSSYTD